MFEKIDELKAAYEKAMTQLKADGEKAIKEMLAEFFKKHPTASGIRWTQYAPSWNDGEACLFSVRDPDIRLTSTGDSDAKKNDDSDDDEEDGDWLDSYDARDKLSPELAADFSKLSETITDDSFEDIMRATFGTDCRVTVAAEKIDISDYDHG